MAGSADKTARKNASCSSACAQTSCTALATQGVRYHAHASGAQKNRGAERTHPTKRSCASKVSNGSGSFSTSKRNSRTLSARSHLIAHSEWAQEGERKGDAR